MLARLQQMPSDEFDVTLETALNGAVKENLIAQDDRDKLESLIATGGSVDAVRGAISDSTAGMSA